MASVAVFMSRGIMKKRKRQMTPNKIAAWQMAVYTALLLLVWVNEFLDFSSIIYGTEPKSMDFVGGCLISAFVLTTAVVNIGHTYLVQAEMLQGLVTICSQCRKIRINQDLWSGLEEYVSRYTDIDFTHGLCPDCYDSEMRDLDAEFAKSTGNADQEDLSKTGGV